MSRYSMLLNTIIAESGLTAKEIVEKCNELGNGIETTRLSKLQNAKLPAPSEKVSRDIAKVCNVDDRKLVIEGYLEKAPKEIIEAFKILKINSEITALRIFENNVNPEQLELIKKELEKQPLSDCVIQILDSKDNTISLSTELFDVKEKDFTFRIEEPIALPIMDNSMFPLIPQNSKISLKLQEKYENGDILALKIKKQENVIARYVLFNGNNMILTSLNKDFETLTYNTKDVTILGKVSKVTNDI